jgi:NADH-quinone oxidoreductase subunit M
MVDFPLLSALTFLPLLGAAVIFLFAKEGKINSNGVAGRGVKIIGLLVTILTFILSLVLYFNFDATTANYQFVEKFEWVSGKNIYYHLGIDGISIYFILLTALLMPICILASWKSVEKQVKEFIIAFLVLETLVIGTFVSLDILLFYFFFEASLIPMFLIIGIWGGENRVYAAFKFFLYTLLGSVLFLLAIIYLYTQMGTTDVVELTAKAPHIALEIQKYLWLALFASFAVKVPMWPVHTWLPDAHVQAPTAGSVILAGILLKLGGYGLLRFSLPMFPDASVYFTPLVYGLSAVAVIYTSLVALMQEDMKKMIAYSSIAHMGFVTAGIFAMNAQGIEGSIFQMLSHGIVSGALFLCVGVLYDRLHTKKIDKFGGVVNVMPKFALLFMVFTMASIGLPATSGFVGEFLIMLGIFQGNTIVAALVATGVVLGAAYMLWLYRRVVYGEITNPDVKKLKDIDNREYFILFVIAVLIIIYGVMPNLVLNDISVSVQNLITNLGTRN